MADTDVIFRLYVVQMEHTAVQVVIPVNLDTAPDKQPYRSVDY